MAPSTDVRRHTSDLYTRTGWVDADVAIGQIDEGKASGDRGILWFRGRIQRQLAALGRILDVHAGKFLFVSLLTIATFSVGLKSMTFHSDIGSLWAESSLPTDTNGNTNNNHHHNNNPNTNHNHNGNNHINNNGPSEMLSTHQMVVQTSVDADVDLLHPHGLLEHLALVQKASQVTVNMYDITWRLKDLCQSPSIPNFDAHYIEQMFENMMPCAIVTPLDCFWEGSKLLGPDYPVHIPYGIGSHITWTNLNPIQLVMRMKQKESQFDYHSLEDYLKRAGITSGYQEKPCLDPRDPECPATAPNYNSSEPLDIGAELTSGCYGFAAKYMHWPEDLIVGGVYKNKSGHIKQAKALQTVVQLMGEQELFEYWMGHYRVHHIGWNQEKATVVLNAWQKRFAQEVDHLTKSKKSSSSYLFVTFSTANLNEILKEHSKTDLVKLGVVLVIATIYCCLTKSSLAGLGVIVLASTAVAALGVCSLIGLPMNLLSTHVLPFVTVGLSLREMFLILSATMRSLPPQEVLRRTGPSVLSAALVNSAAFLVAALVPVPALRVFALQCAILVIFHSAALIIIFPSLLALEQRCRKADVPCFRAETKIQRPANENNDLEHGQNLLKTELICQREKSFLAWTVNKFLVCVVLKPLTKVVVSLAYVVLIIFCAYNGLKLNFDVRLSSFLPKSTQEYKYLEIQNRFFGFYNFYLVTTELEYPLNQPLLYEYHSSLTNVPYVLKDSNGGLNMNDFWLANFRDFLLDLQTEFDNNRSKGTLNSEKWFPNATEKAVLAFKLLSQTGIVEFPVDKSQIFKKKLVINGIIDPKAFYNYLSVWNSNDQISYTSSQANLVPKPFQYYSSKAEFDLKIPKSQPLVYTQMPFYLKNLKTTDKIMETLKQIKDITDEFRNRGLKNYPVGLIFAYFNQFLQFYQLLMAQLALTLLAGALVTSTLVQWTKLWCPVFSILVCMLLLLLVDVSALSGTIGAIHFIIISRNVFLILTGFLTAIGSNERRLKMSLEIYTESMIKGDFGLFICIIVLITSRFEFIQYQLFGSLLLSICCSTLNSFIFFPVLLTLLGPKSELRPSEHDDRISTPPPPPPPLPTRPITYAKPPRRATTTTKATREPSLTTITEESCNQSIVVEPQVTVEYSSPESSSSGPFTTKVTATANIKVELVTPVYRSKCGKCYKSKCNRHRQQCRCCNGNTNGHKTDPSDSSDSNAETEPCPSS